jgi:NNP family nitrate/nitrite transporter-like MFS transporter
LAAAKDYRVWALFVIYAACFGIELTINNIAALYFHDRFHLEVGTAGLIAGLFGLMNIFARTMGGVYSDRLARSNGLKGRVWFLGIVLLLEGLALIIFSRMPVLGIAVMAMIIFSLFVQMSEGATYGIVPFINKRAVGPVAGIVGAGGNAGAVAAGFLFRIESLATQDALLILGILVTVTASLSLLVRFTPEVEAEEQAAFSAALKQRGSVAAI